VNQENAKVSFTEPEKAALNNYMARLFVVLDKLSPGYDAPLNDQLEFDKSLQNARPSGGR
jgi:hypothetical protein